MKKRSLMGLIRLLLAVGVLLMVYFVFCGTPWGTSEFKKDVIRYLEEKYAQEMVVNSNPYYSFELGTYSLSASPIDFKEVKYAVWQTTGNERELGDNYFVTYWAYQANKELNSYLSLAFPDNTVSGKVVIQHEPRLNHSPNAKIMPPSYDEVKGQLRNGTYIFIDFGRELDVEKIDQEYTYIYDIFHYIKQYGYTFDIIKVDFNKQNKLRLNYTDFMNINDKYDLKDYFKKL
ncbi:hypothetical protein ACFQ88_11815 [Paenibacillus sp. NPDC056579]|uniref:YfjL-like protein n=1 Tax=Paenibacillus sp. NPDC056579 TaxID=3345871 RepID=UPI0036815F47